MTTPEDVAHVVSSTRCALGLESGESTAGMDWSDIDPRAFVETVRLHRVSTILAAHVDALAIPAEIADDLRAMARAESLAALRLAVETVRAVETVNRAGAPVLAVKGVPLALQSTGQVTSRGAGDVDLLVAEAWVPAVHEALTAAGWSSRRPLPPPTHRRFWRMRREHDYSSESSSIDLHWRLGWQDRPLPPTSVLLARPAQVSIGGTSVMTLGLADAFSYACYTAAIDRYARLRSLVDIVRLARVPGDLPLAAGMDWRLRRLIAEAVGLADSLLGGVPADRLDVLVPTWTDVGRAHRIWTASSVMPVWWDLTAFSKGDSLRMYLDSARFAGMRAAVAIAATDALMPPERVPSAAEGRWRFAKAVAAEAADHLPGGAAGR